MKKNNNTVKELSSSTIIMAIFIVLKLAGVIKWSWVWVLSPLWIGAIIAVICLALALIFAIK